MASLNTYLIFMLLFTLLSFSSEATPTYSAHYCDNSTSFTPNSTYQANIKTLLSSLSSNTRSSKNGFYNTTAGQDPNLVYGTFLCRGDVSANLCQHCVANAINEIAQRCRMEKTGVIWYDECTVQYSDQNIFSISRQVPGMDNSTSASITDKDRFNQLLVSVMKILENRAAYEDKSGKRFAAGEANFTSSQTLYSLVQCTPDLTNELCFRCLQSAIATLPMCCDGKQGGRVLLPSCNIRYEMFPFYNLNGTGSTVLVPSPSSPNSTKAILCSVVLLFVVRA
ncbi:ATP binding protein, putative [Theobroma cacao]|uniref:ATP binding protein, putative n=1 Tax=Theobroma cacao TaxID=3641 RepID=A0A061GHD3_THECC|nr:ATP binding protein, putative [Theobroma cacao]